MTRLIALTGLVSTQKNNLTIALAQHYVEGGASVHVIDNIARLPLDRDRLPADVQLSRLTGDMRNYLLPMLDFAPAEVIILAAAETANADDFFVLMEELRGQRPDLQLTTLALIDARTCDCFPATRAAFEDYADYAIPLPFSLDFVLYALEDQRSISQQPREDSEDPEQI